MKWGTAMIVFDKLWETMKQRQISTYVLREKYSVESRTIRRLKDNQNVTTDTLNRLCRILNCDLNDIASYLPDPEDGNGPGCNT